MNVFLFFSFSLFRSLSSTLSFVLSFFLIGLGLWLFVGLSICGFEGDGGVRVGFGLGLWLFVGLSICGFEGDGGVRVGFMGLREMVERQ